MAPTFPSAHGGGSCDTRGVDGATHKRSSSLGGALAATWGVVGVVLLLVRGISRLVPHALELRHIELSLVSGAALAAWTFFMAYAEGYRGFQRGFSPRVVARASELARHPTWVRGVLAPLYCMSLFAAERRRMIVSWSLLVMIIGLIVGVSRLAQPWRGIIDAGVVVGLTWGLVALVVFAVRRLGARPQ